MNSAPLKESGAPYCVTPDDPFPTGMLPERLQAMVTAVAGVCVERWNDDAGPLRSCIARWMEQTWKIALVLHAATHGKNSHEVELGQDTAERAVALQEWFARQQLRIVGGGAAKTGITRIGRLCELLRAAPNCEMTLRNLKNSHGFSGGEVRSLVASAPQQLNLQKRQNSGVGRPSWVVGLVRSDSEPSD